MQMQRQEFKAFCLYLCYILMCGSFVLVLSSKEYNLWGPVVPQILHIARFQSVDM